jgi:3',5'-cyclic-AMP phosphodiesterase
MKNLSKKAFLILSIIVLIALGVSINNQFTNPPATNLVIPTPSSAVILSPTFNSSSPLTFAVISDIHSDYAALAKTLEKIKSNKVEFIIVAGDLTTVGAESELLKVKNILDQSKIPYYAIPGNHDLWSEKNGTNPYVNVFGSRYKYFQKDNVRFILMDNASGIIGVDQKQEQWLNSTLSECPKLYCLVFAHMPLNNPYLLHVMGEDSTKVASQAAKLVKEMVNFKVKELFAGHIHYLSTYALDGLVTSTDGAIYTNNNASESRFLEVTVNLPMGTIDKKEIWVSN